MGFDCLRSCNSISIQRWTCWCVWDHCPAAWPKCAWGHKLTARYSPSGFSDRVQKSWFHQLWQVIQVLKLQSSPRPSHYHHHVWLLYDVLFMKCVGFMPDVTGHKPSKNVNFCSISPQNICPKFLGKIKIFLDKCETSLCIIFGQQWLLSWNSPMDAVFAQSLSYCWIMNTDLNWGEWGLQFFRCCSGFFYDLLDKSLLLSWSNFGRPATPEKVHHCSKFSPFVDNGSFFYYFQTDTCQLFYFSSVLEFL